MPAKKPPPKDQKPQKQRFIEAARKAGGIDADGFERAIGKVLPQARRPKAPPKQG